MMQMIIAGDSQEAFRLAVDRCSDRKSWKYVNGVEDLRGLRRGSTVWLYGTYYERKDYDELAEHCAFHDIGLVCV